MSRASSLERLLNALKEESDKVADAHLGVAKRIQQVHFFLFWHLEAPKLFLLSLISKSLKKKDAKVDLANFMKVTSKDREKVI
jgi:hypothetical protein